MTNKILIISDSHGNPLNINRILDKIKGSLNYVIHLGDGTNDLAPELYRDLKIFCVAGNCDFGSPAPGVLRLSVNGRRIIGLHGHRHGVKSSADRICWFAAESDADVCLFGHTHVPAAFYYGKALMLNPGSISRSNLINIPTYGIIDICDGGTVEYSLVGIDKNNIRLLRYGEFYDGN